MSIGSARDFLEAWYGDRLVCNLAESDTTVGIAAVRIAAQDPAAIGREISNNGAAVVFISSLSRLAVNQGIPIAAGTTLNLFVLEDFDLASCDLFAISAAAGNPVHVISVQIVGLGD